MRWTGLLAVCLLLPACASSSPSVGSRSMEGAYIEAGGLYGVEMFRPGYPLSDTVNSGVGGAFRVGYRGETDTAIELFTDDARGFELEYPTGENTRLEIRSLGVAGKFYFVEGDVQPYLLAGVGWASLHFSRRSSFDPITARTFETPYAGANDSFFMRGGLGCEVHFNDTFGAFLEANYNLMAKHLREFDHADGIVGLLVRF